MSYKKGDIIRKCWESQGHEAFFVAIGDASEDNKQIKVRTIWANCDELRDKSEFELGVILFTRLATAFEIARLKKGGYV